MTNCVLEQVMKIGSRNVKSQISGKYQVSVRAHFYTAHIIATGRSTVFRTEE